jgi:S-(hydroxymethyl)glutathione dehydrogenase / alcohol dehydrogenase
MPDGTSRFKDSDGKVIYHFMGCSTMSEYSVIAEISCAKISKEMALDKAALFGCGVTTGLGKGNFVGCPFTCSHYRY